MNSKPILFSAPMIQALLDGRKSVTRRIVKPQPSDHHWRSLKNYELSARVMTGVECSFVRFRHNLSGMPHLTEDIETVRCSYGKPGDLLWCRETWAVGTIYDGVSPSEINPGGKPNWCGIRYAATDERLGLRDRPSIHMPRWASRVTLEIISVKVERLQDITEEDARAEGIADGGCLNCGNPEPCRCAKPSPSPREGFIRLWEEINGPNSWHLDPWVWALSFRVHKCNVDQFRKDLAA